MWPLFGKKMAKTKKMAILKKWQKTPKLRFWATSFDLLTKRIMLSPRSCIDSHEK